MAGGPSSTYENSSEDLEDNRDFPSPQHLLCCPMAKEMGTLRNSGSSEHSLPSKGQGAQCDDKAGGHAAPRPLSRASLGAVADSDPPGVLRCAQEP